MAINPIPHDDSANRLDRSKCVFPASSTDPAAVEHKSVRLDLKPQRKDSLVSDVHTQALPSTLLKAAWVLTLQCYIVADIICFRYSGPTHDTVDGLEHEVELSESTTQLYILRLDRNETVKSFLKRFGEAKFSSTAAEPTGFDIGIVDGRSSHHQCNTTISLQMQGTPTTLLGGETDLQLVMSQPSNGLSSTDLHHKNSHTSDDMAGSILRTFQHIYMQMSAGPDELLLQDIELCSPADLVAVQHATRADTTPSSTCVHDLIIEQCRLRPEETAVCSWDGNLTYRELDDLSLRLARHLVELGVRPETFVLSCFEKSTWAIVARLAILRAGGAYISIHASNPPVYLESVITRTRTHILLTDPNFVDRFRDTVPTVVTLTPEWIRSLPSGGPAKVCAEVQSNNACLVLFTSGSTGTPKGIIQHHQAYATAIKNYARDFKMGTHTRYLQFDDYAFDISNLEFLVPLIIGGTCCVPGPMKTISNLVEQINTLDANTLFITPTVAIKLEPADVPCLKTMCVGGEPLPKDLVHKWAGSATQLINQYGMGEVAICCAYNDNINPVGGAVIGRPSTGAIWVVDPSSPEKLMPIGAVGEIMIEGPHLSRGYLDETSIRRTEAGFLKATPRWMAQMHPDRSSARIYRSGDLGRRNRDGTITYLGRKDTILKLDGCRIDALEVEHQARKCLSDKDTIIVDLLGIINGQEDPSLTAFLYLDDHPASTTPVPNGVPFLLDALQDPFAAKKVEEVRDSIAQSLPRYMVPTTFVLMTYIPRTASKKIDRKKMHHLGQTFYFLQLEERSKDVSYAQRIQALPI